MLKYITLIIWLFGIAAAALAQNTETDYQLIADLNTQMQRKVEANELMLDANEEYIIVNYGNKPTYIIIYSFTTYELIANFRLTNWVDFSGAYFDSQTKQLYIKESRFSKEYYRMDVATGKQEIIPCRITPKGCPTEEPKQALKSIFDSSKNFYIAIDKRNPRKVKVYQLKK